MGQCAKSRSFQRWVMAQRPGGKGRGLCDVRTKNSRTKNSSIAKALWFDARALSPSEVALSWPSPLHKRWSTVR